MAKALGRALFVCGFAIAVAAVLFRQAPVSYGKSITLAQDFPELADLPNARAVQIEIGWMGLSPHSPLTAAYLLDLRNNQYEGTGMFVVATEHASRPISVPRDAVRSFLTAAINVEMAEKEYTARITHTDDYPSLAFAIDTEKGPLQIETRSQAQRIASASYLDWSPWAIHYLHRTFVVTASDLDRAVDSLLPLLKYNEAWDSLEAKLRPHN
jgi:hypothetical protein